MPSENYRYYCLDGIGQLHSAEWFYAASDEDAVTQIKAKHPDGMCEIWEGPRFVAQVRSRVRHDAVGQTRRAMADSYRILRDTAHLVPRSSGTDGDAR